MVKNNTGRKHSVLKDELGIKGGGIYCLTPFDRIDENGKTVFKIGQSVDLENRLNSYHTDFPTGLYICCILENPPIRTMGTRKYVKADTKIAKYLKIEKFIFDYISERGAVQVYSTARIKNANVNKEGATEWFYSDELLIQEAFNIANKKFGGTLHLFYLPDLNKEYETKSKKKPNFIGNIVYHFPKH